MANRTRPVLKRIWLTADEWAVIQEKMKQADIENYSDYIRQMSLKGYVIEVDFSAVKELAKEVGGISRNINQIAKRINTTDTVYKEDLTEIQEYMKKVWQLLRYTLLNQRSEKR